MKYKIALYQDGAHLQTVDIDPAHESTTNVTFAFEIAELANLLPSPARRRRRNRPVREAIERFTDPEREHPLIKNLFSTIAPLAISFLTNQLPEWLGDIDLSSTAADDPDGQ